MQTPKQTAPLPKTKEPTPLSLKGSFPEILKYPWTKHYQTYHSLGERYRIYWKLRSARKKMVRCVKTDLGVSVPFSSGKLLWKYSSALEMRLVTDHLASVPIGQRHISLEHRWVWLRWAEGRSPRQRGKTTGRSEGWAEGACRGRRRWLISSGTARKGRAVLLPIQYSAVSAEKPRQLVSYVMVVIRKFYKHSLHSAIQGFEGSIEQCCIRDGSPQNPTQHFTSVRLWATESSSLPPQILLRSQ